MLLKMLKSGIFVVVPLGALWSAIAKAALVVSVAPTSNVVCASGRCAPTASNAVLNVSDLEKALQAGNLSMTTTGSSGVEATDISVTVPFSWDTTSTLSLTSYHSIDVSKKVLVGNGGGLTITTNTGGTDGRMVFGKSGRVEFHRKSSPVVINGTSYVLADSVADIRMVASGKRGLYIALMNDYDAAVDGTYSSVTAEVNTFEGFGNTISNYTLVDTDRGVRGTVDAGLFESAQDIRDLRLLNVSVTADLEAGAVGGLAGFTGGSLAGDEVSGTVSGKRSFVGGLVGTSYGSITASSSSTNVSGGQAGALTAWERNNGTILQSSASGSVYSDRGQAGGLVWLLSEGATISQSFSTAHVSTKKLGSQVGGIAGEIAVTQPDDAAVTIINSYSRGETDSKARIYVGGFVGYENSGNITTSYSTTVVHHPATAGGFTGYNYVAINTSNYWDTTTSKETVGIRGSTEGGQNGVTGLTDAQLKSGLPASFDPSIWAQNPAINDGYPYLINNPPQ